MAAIVEYFGYNFFIAIWGSYAVMPFLDCFLSIDNSNVKKEAQRKFERDPRFKIPIYCVIFFDFCLYFYLMTGIASGRLGKTPLELAVYMFGGALLGSINTTAGHELFHKRQTVHKIFGILPWFKMLSGHLYMYHL
jgi:fatty acid desaturase